MRYSGFRTGGNSALCYYKGEYIGVLVSTVTKGGYAPDQRGRRKSSPLVSPRRVQMMAG